MDDNKTDSVLHRIFRRDKLSAATPTLSAGADLLPVIPVPLPPAPVKPSFGSRFIFAIARLVFKMQATPFWEKHLTTLFYGPRSQGKSLHQAKTVKKILEWLEALYRFYPTLPQSVVVSNQKFNAEIEGKYLGKRLYYWENIQQLKFCPRVDCWKDEYTEQPQRAKKGVPQPPRKVKTQHRLHDCYIIMDDAATIIPADGWQDLPIWFRKMWAQAGHNGIHAIANIQDPVSCDINFRRYTDIAFKFNKVMGNKRPEAGKPLE